MRFCNAVQVLAADSVTVPQEPRDTGTVFGTLQLPPQTIYRCLAIRLHAMPCPALRHSCICCQGPDMTGRDQPRGVTAEHGMLVQQSNLSGQSGATASGSWSKP